MTELKEFSIPIKGLKQEHYQFDFQIDSSFFACFDASPISESDISVFVELDKRIGLMEFFFDIEGTIKTECDRCLATIDLPIYSEERLIVKYTEEPQEDTDEVVFIHTEASEFNIAPYIYEYICVMLPITKVYDCENDEVPPCDVEMLNRISGESNLPPQTEGDSEEKTLSNLLKNININ
jgi:uncharacterized metal-binding protein YceD (DUF177 family)